MSHALQTQIVENIADEDGEISVSKTRVEEPDVDVNINIRQDDLRMFWTDDGDLILRTSEMDEDVYLQPMPSAEGFECEVVINPQTTLTETEPAEPAEQPDVDETSFIEIRMD